MATVDHVVPVSKGGSHRWDNVRLAHLWCNVVRGNKPAHEVFLRLATTPSDVTISGQQDHTG